MSDVIISIRDKKSEQFQGVCQARNLATAERMFKDILSDKNSVIGKHPEDFDLYLLARVDMDNGAIDAKDCPLKIADGGSLHE